MEWQYEKREPIEDEQETINLKNISKPAAEVITHLQNMVKIGDIHGLTEWVEEAQKNKTNIHFSNQMAVLVNSFDLRELQRFLN